MASQKDELQRNVEAELAKQLEAARLAEEAKLEAARLAEEAKKVKNGELVYIKVAGTETYLAEPCHGTYVAVTGERSSRGKFQIELGKNFIRIAYAEPHRYLQEFKYLYAARTCSAKYDEKSMSTTQLWVLDTKCSIDLKVGVPVNFLDKWYFSNLVANTSLAANAGAYEGGRGKKWVEARCAGRSTFSAGHINNPQFKLDWELERVGEEK